MDVKERLRKARNFLKLSQEALAIETGSQRTTVAGYEGGVSLPRAEFLRELSVKYNINPNWILTGQGDMLNTVAKKAPIEEELQKIIDQTVSPLAVRLSQVEAFLKNANSTKQAITKPEREPPPLEDNPQYTAEPEPEYGDEEEEEDRDHVPYLHGVAAGPPRAIGEDASQYVEVPKRLLRKGERYYATSIRGTSMTGAGILDGDMVLIRWTNVPKDGAIQVVRYKDKVTLKRMRAVEGKGWELRYMDGSGQVVSCDSSEYEVIGEFDTILPKGTVPKER